tara:strand:+ start:133 stop:405 length:273 start_codon:yes stop_codon:yes gene_type:complete
MIKQNRLKQALYHELNKLGYVHLQKGLSLIHNRNIYTPTITYLYAKDIETSNKFDGYVKLGDGQVIDYRCELKDEGNDSGLQSIHINIID